MNIRETNRETRLSFAFFSLKGRLRFKPSELAIAEIHAILDEFHWFEDEAKLFEKRRVGK